MKKTLVLFILGLCACNTLSAQHYRRSFKGTVTDSATTKPLKDVTVSFYNAKDTSLVNFNFTTTNGNYTIELHIKDSLLMIVSCIGYKEKVIHIHESLWEWDFESKDIVLAHSSYALKEIKITEGLISMKGDTIEINASRIKILPNSDVSQLFQKIPGFEIKKDGTIKVNGNDVSKILVDGSDFFGSSPAMVSKNLNADMVDKVQVFDDKDDNGVAARNNTKTINLKLKKGKRIGVFGDALAGAGTGNHYEGGLRLNSFKDDRKWSFISNSNNINDRGFDFGFNNWHRASSVSPNGSFNQYVSYSNNAESAESKGNLNTKSDAAFTYFNEFPGKKKLSLNAGYNNNNYITDKSYTSLNPINDTTKQVSTNTQTTTGTANEYNVGLNYTQEMDTTGRFGISVDGHYDKYYQNYQSTNAIYSNTTLINGGNNDYQKYTTEQSAAFNISYYIRSKKSRYKYFSIAAKSSIDNTASNMYQYSQGNNTNFNYKSINSKIGSENLMQATGVLPIYKSFRVGLTADGYYMQNINHTDAYSASNFSTQNYSQDYSQKIDSLGINFFNSARQVSAKGFLSLGEKNYNLSAGVSYIHLTLYNQDRTFNQTVYKNYNLFLPYITYSNWKRELGYTFVTFEKVVDFPTYSQLIPLRNLSDPWLRLIGNQNLLPFEQWSFSSYFNKTNYKFLKTIWGGINFQQSDNYLTYTNSVDNHGITYRTPVNLKGYYSENVNIGPTIKCSKIINVDIWFDQQYKRTPEFSNGVENISQNSELNFVPGLEILASDAVEFRFDVTFTYTKYQNQLNPSLNFNQLIKGIGSDLRIDLWKGSELKLALEMSDDRAIPGIGKIVTSADIYLQQALDKKGKYNVKFTCYDLLNQNVSLTRSASGSYVNIQQSNILQRFFMLTFVYKMKGNKTEGGGATY